MNQLKKLLRFGNAKLPKSTAIFNMGSATHCPSAKKGLCELRDICYALKAERIYKSCLPYRTRQANYWLSTSAIDFAIDFFCSIATKRSKVRALRLNESGDFYSQECVDKAEAIAALLSSRGITVYGYTHRRDLDYSNCKNLVVMGSGFTAEGTSGSFVAVAEFSGSSMQCPADCTKCSLCQVRHGKTIEALKH